MESNIIRYIFDANAIRGLSYETIEHKRNANTILETTSDIIYELGDRAANKLKLLNVCKMSASIYKKMPQILKHPNVRALLDYYNNKGVGDIGIIAHALTVNDGMLLTDKIIVVTDDEGLKAACDELKIIWLSPNYLKVSHLSHFEAD